MGDLLREHGSEIRHALRVAAAALAAFTLESWLNLPQGYWAVFTAVLVVQTSIGGALVASRDRLIGTFAGAVVGGAASYLRPQTESGEAIALALAVGVLAVGAAKNASLKIGPVTAAILILTNHQDGSLTAAALRVAEIMLGSVIGVAATLFIFPARAHRTAALRAAALLDQFDTLFGFYGEALARRETPADSGPLNAAIRAGLVGLEVAAGEAAREARAHLSAGRLPDALPRTLWRVRNDAVVIGRSLSRLFPPVIADRLSTPAGTLMQAVRAELTACAAALRAGRAPPPTALTPALQAFHTAFQDLRGAGVMRDLEFEEIGHAFGLAWTFDLLERNLSDLADRVAEMGAGAPASRAEAEG